MYVYVPRGRTDPIIASACATNLMGFLFLVEFCVLFLHSSTIAFA